MTTVGERLRAYRGLGPGFNTLRLAAASLVLVSHTFPITTGSDAAEPLYQLSHGQYNLGTIAVFAFFGMSGFLVTPSLARSGDLLHFAWRRALRLVPALLLVLLVTALVVGPVLAGRGFPAYAGSSLSYLKSALLNASTPLPGAFSRNPMSAANGSLWTLKYEVLSYMSLMAFGAIGLLRRRWTVVALVAAGLIVTTFFPGAIGRFQSVQALLDLWTSFGVGVVFALYADILPFNWALAAGAAVVSALSAVFGFGALILPVSLTYLVIALGMIELPTLRIRGVDVDYSYGIYLWAFLVQQIVEFLAPSSAVVNMVAAMLLTLCASALSWHLLERPALKLKSLPFWPTRASSEPGAARPSADRKRPKVAGE